MPVLGVEVDSGGQDITGAAAKLVRAMIVSCGSTGCVATMKMLDSVSDTVPYDSVARIEGYGYRLKVFERLQHYANVQKLKVIGVSDVARYFGGTLHIDIMAEHAGHAGLARFLGEAAGLVTHVLLPLDGRTYRNAGQEVHFENVYELNPGEPGIPCFHLGVIVKIPLTEGEVAEILAEQASSKAFTGYLAEVGGNIHIPDQYYYALNCLATKDDAPGTGHRPPFLK